MMALTPSSLMVKPTPYQRLLPSSKHLRRNQKPKYFLIYYCTYLFFFTLLSNLIKSTNNQWIIAKYRHPQLYVEWCQNCRKSSRWNAQKHDKKGEQIPCQGLYTRVGMKELLKTSVSPLCIRQGRETPASWPSSCLPQHGLSSWSVNARPIQ